MIDSFKGQYRWLSNFYPCKVEVDGMRFPSSEHAYMSFKSSGDFTTPEEEDRPSITAPWKTICQSLVVSCKDIKKWGSLVKIDVPDWDSKRPGIMLKVVSAKFEQNPDLAQKLLDTGDQELIEGNNWGDTYWGMVNGVGENHLGNILMTVRTALKFRSL